MLRKATVIKDDGSIETHLSEYDIHKTIVAWALKHPRLKDHIIHIPNEGKRSLSYARKLRALGMRSGVSDLFIALPRHGYHGAWIEIKKKNGKISETQRKFLHDMRSANYFIAVVYSIDEGIETLKWYYSGNNPI